MKGSAIEWTQDTLNPWTGCRKVDPACAYCYIDRTPPFRIAGRRFEGGNIPLVFHMDRLERMMRRRRPTLYFVNSLSDVFHEDVSEYVIAQLFTAMRRAEQHTFQVLTKRHERMRDLMRRLAWRSPTTNEREEADRPIWRRVGPQAYFTSEPDGGLGSYVCPNVWLGVTIGNRQFVHRADALRETPAAVRFISAEPLLGPLIYDSDVGMARDGWPTDPDDEYLGVPEHLRGDAYTPCWEDGQDLPELDLTAIDWLIVGGESGGPPRRRLVDEQGQPRDARIGWVRDLRDACLATRWPCNCCAIGAPPDHHAPECDSHGGGTAFFFKQWGGSRPKSSGRELDRRTWDELPARDGRVAGAVA